MTSKSGDVAFIGVETRILADELYVLYSFSNTGADLFDDVHFFSSLKVLKVAAPEPQR